MGLISGTVSCTRLNVVSIPEEPNFDHAAFRAIQPRSRVRESIGFVPFELEEPYLIGDKMWAFRIRIDRLQPDATLLKERLRELIKLETEQAGPPNSKKIKALKMLAEDEILEQQAPRSKIIECVISDYIVYVGSTAKTHLGTVISMLKRVGIEVEFKTPWLDAGLDVDPPDWMDLKSPAQSVLGSQFLKKLLSDPSVFVEGVKGHVKLVTQDGSKVALSAAVTQEMERYLDAKAAFLSAKIALSETPFTFDALAYRITALKIRSFKADHWTTVIDARMELIKEIWDAIDQKYQDHMNR